MIDWIANSLFLQNSEASLNDFLNSIIASDEILILLYISDLILSIWFYHNFTTIFPFKIILSSNITEIFASIIPSYNFSKILTRTLKNNMWWSFRNRLNYLSPRNNSDQEDLYDCYKIYAWHGRVVKGMGSFVWREFNPSPTRSCITEAKAYRLKQFQ